MRDGNTIVLEHTLVNQSLLHWKNLIDYTKTKYSNNKKTVEMNCDGLMRLKMKKKFQ